MWFEIQDRFCLEVELNVRTFEPGLFCSGKFSVPGWVCVQRARSWKTACEDVCEPYIPEAESQDLICFQWSRALRWSQGLLGEGKLLGSCGIPLDRKGL